MFSYTLLRVEKQVISRREFTSYWLLIESTVLSIYTSCNTLSRELCEAVLNRISHGTDSSRRCDKFDRIFHIRTKVKNTFCGFRVFNPNEFVTH